MKYLLFEIEHYYPGGGFNDFHSLSNSQKELKENVLSILENEVESYEKNIQCALEELNEAKKDNINIDYYEKKYQEAQNKPVVYKDLEVINITKNEAYIMDDKRLSKLILILKFKDINKKNILDYFDKNSYLTEDIQEVLKDKKI